MSDFKDLGSQLTGLSKIYQSRKGDKARIIIDSWDQMFGNSFNRKVKPDRIVNGVLFLKVSDSAWLNQMTFLKEDVLMSCNKKVEADFIKEVKCFIGDVSVNVSEVKKDSFKPKERKFYSLEDQLTEEDKRAIELSTNKIEDEEMRNALKNLLQKSRILETSLTKQGWKKCIKCSALHNTKEMVCFSCSQNPDKPQSKYK